MEKERSICARESGRHLPSPRCCSRATSNVTVLPIWEFLCTILDWEGTRLPQRVVQNVEVEVAGPRLHVTPWPDHCLRKSLHARTCLPAQVWHYGAVHFLTGRSWTDALHDMTTAPWQLPYAAFDWHPGNRQTHRCRADAVLISFDVSRSMSSPQSKSPQALGFDRSHLFDLKQMVKVTLLHNHQRTHGSNGCSTTTAVLLRTRQSTTRSILRPDLRLTFY